MPPLVLYDEQAEFLELAPGTDAVLITELVANVTTLFEKSCGRDTAPFAGALTGRTEIHEGDQGSRLLYLDYPISTVTSIALGPDVALPDETLAPTDPTKVVWRAGSRLLTRTDGGVWKRWAPRWVKVVYDTQDDRPADVKLAIKRRVASLYRLRGSEGLISVTQGARSWTVATSAQEEEDAVWRDAVNNHRRNWVR